MVRHSRYEALRGYTLSYKFKMQLYQHQKEIVEADPKKSGIFQGCGSGKTRTALALATGRVLVVCPKTQRDDENWQREAKMLRLDIDLTVMSKEEFRRDVLTLPKFDTVIVDEAHTCLGVTPSTHFKNRMPRPKASQLFYSLKEFIEKTKPERVYLVTATIVKSPMTVWGAGVILGAWSGGIESFYKFRSIYYVRLPMAGREVYSPKSDKETKERLARLVKTIGFVGRLEDYFDVPEQTFHDEYVDLTVDQKKAIKEARLDYPDPIVAIGKINQIENGILAGDDYNKAQVFKENKTQRLLDYSIEFPRMIVFAKYTTQIENLEKAFKKEGKKVFTLTGKTKDRGELFRQVNACDDYVFICQSQISAGWEIPDCPVMIFASRNYSFVDYSQALGRILRANHLKKNLYINLIAKSEIDMAIHNALKNKQDFDEKLYVDKSLN